MAGASFGGPLLIRLLKFTLKEKLLAHSLQFRTKFHVYSDSLRAQITEHTEYNYVTAALYCVGEELEKIMRTNRQTENRQTDREFNYRGHSNPCGLSGWAGQLYWSHKIYWIIFKTYSCHQPIPLREGILCCMFIINDLPEFWRTSVCPFHIYSFFIRTKFIRTLSLIFGKIWRTLWTLKLTRFFNCS